MFLDTNAWKFYGKVVCSFSFSTRGQLHVGCPSGTPQFRVLQPDNSTQAVCASDLYFLGKVSGTLIFKNQLIINSISGSLYDLNTKKKNDLVSKNYSFKKSYGHDLVSKDLRIESMSRNFFLGVLSSSCLIHSTLNLYGSQWIEYLVPVLDSHPSKKTLISVKTKLSKEKHYQFMLFYSFIFFDLFFPFQLSSIIEHCLLSFFFSI